MAPSARSLALVAVGLAATGQAAAQAPGAGEMHALYAAFEARLLSEGRLREAASPADAPWDAETLARNFARIALRSEYGVRGGRFVAGSRDGVLRRWGVPVRLGVRFGASVPAAQRRRDVAEMARYAARLQGITGHPVSLTAGEPNFLVLVVGEAERRALGPTLARLAPDLSRAARRAILAMPPETLCLVLAQPHRDPALGYRRAVAVVRAEHPPRLRRSCVQEELAQAMGLPDDSRAARPSIFNDDEEFGVLTRHDEALLRMLYDPRLRPGMTPEQVAPLLPEVARAAASR